MRGFPSYDIEQKSGAYPSAIDQIPATVLNKHGGRSKLLFDFENAISGSFPHRTTFQGLFAGEISLIFSFSFSRIFFFFQNFFLIYFVGALWTTCIDSSCRDGIGYRYIPRSHVLHLSTTLFRVCRFPNHFSDIWIFPPSYIYSSFLNLLHCVLWRTQIFLHPTQLCDYYLLPRPFHFDFRLCLSIHVHLCASKELWCSASFFVVIPFTITIYFVAFHYRFVRNTNKRMLGIQTKRVAAPTTLIAKARQTEREREK